MQNYYGMAIRQNILSSQNNGKEKALHSMKKNQFSSHCGTVQICLTTKRDMHFVLGNPIVGVNIGKMEAMKIISYLSICQKLSRIYLCQYFQICKMTTYYPDVQRGQHKMQMKPLIKLFGKSVQRIYLFQDMYQNRCSISSY